MASFPGISKPESLLEPTQDELDLSTQILAVVDALDSYENDSSLTLRGKLVETLGDIVEEWIRKDLEISDNEECYSKMLAFGSQQFGVVSKGGDLDIVCMVSKSVSRKKVFREFPDVLVSLTDVEVTRVVEFARVPIIQFIFNGVEIDMCLAVMNVESIPADFDISADKILHGMDEASVCSLNGYRENKSLLNLVPNVETFKSTLKVVKLWAKRNHVHHNALGYPGGAAWSIMVARVCQLYPLASVIKVVAMVFKIYSVWNWPTPVLLTQISDKDPYKMSPWNPKIKRTDGAHLMPVITPTYPEKNSLSTASRSTLAILNEELRTASCLVQSLIQHKDRDCEALFKHETVFFHKYKHYLVISAISETVLGHLNWDGLIESRIRVLVQILEKESCFKTIHPYAVSFSSTDLDKKNKTQTNWFLGLNIQIDRSAGQVLDLVTPIKEFIQHVTTLARERNISSDGRTVEVVHAKRKDVMKHCLSNS